MFDDMFADKVRLFKALFWLSVALLFAGCVAQVSALLTYGEDLEVLLQEVTTLTGGGPRTTFIEGIVAVMWLMFFIAQIWGIVKHKPWTPVIFLAMIAVEVLALAVDPASCGVLSDLGLGLLGLHSMALGAATAMLFLVPEVKEAYSKKEPYIEYE